MRVSCSHTAQPIVLLSATVPKCAVANRTPSAVHRRRNERVFVPFVNIRPAKAARKLTAATSAVLVSTVLLPAQRAKTG